MKHTFLLLMLILSMNSYAQEKKNALIFNFQSTHYSNNEESYGQFIPINPGIELLYKTSFNEKWGCSTGINYSYSKYLHRFGSSEWIRNAQEISIPVIMERNIGKYFSLSFGSYAGWLLKGKEETINKFSGGQWINLNENTGYDESQKFTCDLYCDFKYHLVTNTKLSVLLGPFIKYKLTDNWMQQRRKPFSFGINIGFEI